MRTFDRRPQLIVYPDSLGGTLQDLIGLLSHDMAGWFPGGVHLLPPFPSTGDRGFAPTCYDRIEPRFGAWSDLEQLAALGPLTVDVMVNHISRQSPEFLDFVQHGLESPTADLFMRPDKVWADWPPPSDDLAKLFLRRPGDPLLEVPIGDGATTELVWATFGASRHESEQIDLDWRSPLTQAKYETWFSTLAGAGVSEVRLDAVGYLTKRAGTSCFMVEPEIWDVLEGLASVADAQGLGVLPEVHDEAPVVARLDDHGYPTYDFVLPALLLDALGTATPGPLVEHLANLPNSRVTTLDCHDGIPIQPDLVGVLPKARLVDLTARLVASGANVNRILGAEERGIDFDAHQVNISYLDAAGGEDGLALARAVQLFSPGRPQVYYLGLLGGGNDQRGVVETGEGRAINRTNYSIAGVRRALASRITQRQRRVLEVRAEHPAFAAERPTVDQTGPSTLRIRWDSDLAWCELRVDLDTVTAELSMSPWAGLTPGLV